MWVIVIIAVIAFIVYSRSSGGRPDAQPDLDSGKIRNMIESTGGILDSLRNAQDEYPQLGPYIAKLDAMHAVLCSFPRTGFMEDMRRAVEGVVSVGDGVVRTMPSDVQPALLEYIDTLRHSVFAPRGVGRDQSAISAWSPVDFQGLSFEGQFRQMCEFLGCSEGVFITAMGSPDESLTNEYGTTFHFYGRCASLVTIDSDSRIAKFIDAPKCNAYGASRKPSEGSWVIGAVKLGATRAEVHQAWGPPSKSTEYWEVYRNTQWSTKGGIVYETTVNFESKILSSFGAGLEE